MKAVVTLVSKPVAVPEESLEESASPAASIVAALAYSSLFDYPLTLEEIVRYQVGTQFSPKEIVRCLDEDFNLAETVGRKDGYFFIQGSDDTVQARTRRRVLSNRLWRRARVYARLASHIPFVRMVAVTGALAVDNITQVPDIDLMVVTEDGRVWICRRLLIVLVRIARLFGDDVCPNYIVAASNLHLEQQDFFTAHELAQMVPLYGDGTYSKLVASNAWARTYLPCGFAVRPVSGGRQKRVLRSSLEKVLRASPFSRWERWELLRLRQKLRPVIGESAEVVCSETQCKGHTAFHRRSIMQRYSAVLDLLGVPVPEVLRKDLEEAQPHENLRD